MKMKLGYNYPIPTSVTGHWQQLKKFFPRVFIFVKCCKLQSLAIPVVKYKKLTLSHCHQWEWRHLL